MTLLRLAFTRGHKTVFSSTKLLFWKLFNPFMPIERWAHCNSNRKTSVFHDECSFFFNDNDKEATHHAHTQYLCLSVKHHPHNFFI